ncbi:MAG: dicarboxylate/amino acid:cation symporter [Rikenellaceae bacterium]
MKIKGVAIYWLIFIGMLAGLALGALAVFAGRADLIVNWITPLGDMFIRLLQLIAVPLLFVSLIKGIINLKDTARIASLSLRTLYYYMLSTAVATVLGIALVMILRPGDLVTSEMSQQHFELLSSQVASTIDGVNSIAGQSPLQPIVDMIPSNAIDALSGGTSMLQTLVLAILLGVAIVTLKGERVETFKQLVLDLDSILSRCIDMVMNIAPVGIAALMASVMVASDGDTALLGALGYYFLTALIGFLIMALVVYPLAIKFLTKSSVGDYMRAMIPVQLMAISTSSSAATLPTTMKVANEDLKIPQNITSFTLPMGVTINMDGTSIYLAVTVVFISQVMNIDLSAGQLLLLVATALIASVGTPGIPGGALVTLIMILNTVGIPVESITLIIALFRPLDMFVTAVNVTGDVAVAAVVADSVSE